MRLFAVISSEWVYNLLLYPADDVLIMKHTIQIETEVLPVSKKSGGSFDQQFDSRNSLALVSLCQFPFIYENSDKFEFFLTGTSKNSQSQVKGRR